MPARALMFQGTGSDVGKSLDRRRPGARLHAARPQRPAVQAAEHVEQCGGDGGRRRDRPRAGACRRAPRACRPSVHMNPVLLKPQSEIGAQIVVQGRVYGSAKAAAYQHMKRDLLPFVLDSFARLRSEADHRAGRRRRQRRRSQSARQRHRQYGICARRRCAGGADRRYRPRRRDREPRRHQGRDRAGGRGADLRLHRQQISRRSRRCLPPAWSALRS